MKLCRHPLRFQVEVIAPWSGGAKAGWWCSNCGALKEDRMVIRDSKITMDLAWRWRRPNRDKAKR